MDTSQLPLSDLDLFCDWSGDPNDPIEVRMTIEVLCVPNTTVPIITTGFPVLKVEKSSIRPIEAKLDVNGKSQRSSNEPCSQSPQTPETKPTAFPRDFSPLLDFNDFSPLPTPGNVIVRDKTGGTGSADKPGLADLMRNPANVTPPSSRKRSAKAASLPDSVTDSERGYGSSKHKGKYSGDDSQSTIISLRHSIKPSLIPRPVSAFNNPTEPARVPLPTDSAPTSVADYGRFEELPLIHKEDVPKGNLKENQNPNTPLFTATVDDFDELLLQGTKTKSEQDLEKLSTVASPGTPYDRESSPDVSGFSLGVPADEVEAMSSSPPPVPLPLHPDHPRLIVVDKHYHVHTPADAVPSQHTVCITFLLCMQKGRPKGWWQVIFPNLPRLRHNESGYIYFWVPPDQGLEIRTTHLKRWSINQSCMIAQFALPFRLILPLRLCDGHFYGFLRDFQVVQTIHSEVVNEDDLRYCRVKHVAVCSITMVARDFWSEKCGVSLFIHGGPEGDFTCTLMPPMGRFPKICLETECDTPPGISSIQIICSPLSLVSFSLAWEVRLPRGQVLTWMPRIKSSPEMDDVESELQAEYVDAVAKKNVQTITVESVAPFDDEPPASRPGRLRRVWFSRRWRQAFSFVFVLFICRLLYRAHDAICSCTHAGVRVVGLEVVPPQTVRVPLVADVTEIRGITIEALAPVGIPNEVDTIIEELPHVPEEGSSLAEDTMDAALDVPKMDAVEPSQPTITPSLSLRDRIDYLLGWRGPLGEL